MHLIAQLSRLLANFLRCHAGMHLCLVRTRPHGLQKDQNVVKALKEVIEEVN